MESPAKVNATGNPNNIRMKMRKNNITAKISKFYSLTNGVMNCFKINDIDWSSSNKNPNVIINLITYLAGKPPGSGDPSR